ncbi:MAG: 50S ribosomal protein L19 [Saprospiraceae bacterium]|nr:50S ribosomal protein L19 [Saprospiraceae bacterium]
MSNLINFVEEETARDLSNFDFFKSGDTVAVSYRIIEGNKQRLQVFRGDVIQIKGTGVSKTFTVRKISHGVGVERIFPLNSPAIASIKNLKKGNVRRARLYYLRELTGKSSRIKEKQFTKKIDDKLKGKTRKMSWVWEDKVYK